MKKLIKMLSVISLLCLVIVAGCSSSNTSGSAQNASGSSSDASGKTTITYWASQEGASMNKDKKILKQVTADFEKKTGIHVKFKIIPWSNLWQKTLTAVSSGTGPDVIDLGNTWASSLAATGGFVSLTPDKMKKIGGKSKFLSSAFSLTGLPGKPPMSVPYMSEALGLFYNKKMFKEAGIKAPPKTWTEFVKDAKKLTKDGVYGVGLDGAEIADNSHKLFVMLRQYGGRIYKNGKPVFDSKAAQNATGFLADLITKYKVMDPNSAEWSAQDYVSAFAHGQIAMMMQQDVKISQLKALGMTKDQYGVASLPMIPYGMGKQPSGATKTASHVGGINLGIMKSSDHLQAALKFLKYMTSPDVQVTLNKSFTTLPSVKKAYDNPAFKTPHMKVFAKILKNYATGTPAVKNYGQVEQAVGGALKSILAAAALKNLTPDQINNELTKANAKIASISK